MGDLTPTRSGVRLDECVKSHESALTPLLPEWPEDYEPTSEELAEVQALVRKQIEAFFAMPDQAAQWLSEPHAVFGNLPPRESLNTLKGLRALHRYLAEITLGHPA